MSSQGLKQQQETKLLSNELQHRTNKLLTVIQSIASRSLSGDRSLGEGRQIFEARLQALSKTHRRLTNSGTGWVTLEDVVRAELEAFLPQATIEGDEILLDYQQVQKFSLAIHELTTNALKYGALATPRRRRPRRLVGQKQWKTLRPEASLEGKDGSARCDAGQRGIWHRLAQGDLCKNAAGLRAGRVCLRVRGVNSVHERCAGRHGGHRLAVT